MVRVRAEMPLNERPRPPRLWLALGGVIGLMLLTIVNIALDARAPSGYRGVHWTGPWIYPTDDVVQLIGVTIFEAAIACWVLSLRVSVTIAARAFVLATVAFGVFAAGALVSMHADQPFLDVVCWPFLLSAWLVMFSIVSAIQAHRQQRAAAAS